MQQEYLIKELIMAPISNNSSSQDDRSNMNLEQGMTDDKNPQTTVNTGLLTDPYGLPLVPQPSSDPMDPLNWSQRLKILVVVQTSMIAFTTQFCDGLVVSLHFVTCIAYHHFAHCLLQNPIFVPLSQFMHEDLVVTGYVSTFFVLCAGIGSFFWIPFTNVYGRRPFYILALAAECAFLAASGASKTFGTLMTVRALTGIFGGIPLALGSATVVDLFYTHERGLYMGVFTILLISGAHVAPIAGGFIAQTLSWQWCFYIPSIACGVQLALFIFTVPETLFSRSPEALANPSPPWKNNLFLTKQKTYPARKLHLLDFVRPLKLLLLPDVLLPTLYYSLTFTYGSSLFSISASNLFHKVYNFGPGLTGVLLGVPLTVGSLLGELMAGRVSDWYSNKRAIARGGAHVPEDRLITMIPGALLTPIGIIIEGVCLYHRTHWAPVAVGITIGSIGVQIVVTAVYSYTAEVSI